MTKRSDVNIDDISVAFTTNGMFWDFEAEWHGSTVGKVLCSRRDDRLEIADFKVDDKFPVPWPFMHILPVILIPIRKRNFQGMGVGTLLVNRVQEEAQKAGIQEIWGSVVQSDIARKPNLINWYEGRGFMVLVPDHECMDGARHKISWKSE